MQEMLGEDNTRQQTCLEWQKKLDKCNETEDVPVAVDTLRRILAKIILDPCNTHREPSEGKECIGT